MVGATTLRDLEDAVQSGIGQIFGQDGAPMTSATGDAVQFLAVFEKPIASDQNRTIDAQALYQNLYEAQLEKMAQTMPPAEIPPGDVKTAVAEHLISELETLGRADLSDAAKAEVTRLVTENDATSFAQEVFANEAAVKEGEAEARATRNNDPDARVATEFGLMAILLTKNADDEKPNLGELDFERIDTSPYAQAVANESSAFNNIFEFANAGNEGEKYLAMLHGVPYDTWGELAREHNGYEGLNDMAGLAGDPRQFRVLLGMEEPNDALFGSDGVDPANRFRRDDYSVAPGFPEGAVNMDTLFTNALVADGIVEFATPQDQQNFNLHMAGMLAGNDAEGVEPAKSAREFLELMREFAQTHPGIEMTADNEQRTVNPNAFVMKSMADLPEHIQAAHYAELVAHDIDSGVEPVTAMSSVAFLFGENGVAQVAEADPSITPQVGRVQEFAQEFRSVDNAFGQGLSRAEIAAVVKSVDPNMGMDLAG